MNKHVTAGLGRTGQPNKGCLETGLMAAEETSLEIQRQTGATFGVLRTATALTKRQESQGRLL